MKHRTEAYVAHPPLARFLFDNLSIAWIWLLVRVYVGWQWFQAGEHKLTDPNWVATGEALKNFWARQVAIPAQGRPPISFDWYRDFLNMLLEGGHYTWFAKLVTYTEMVIGIALILGAFVGIAAFFGAFMNWNFMMAGTASTNPLLFAFAIGLMLAWKTAGYWGLDRYLLPLVGTPMRPGRVFPASRKCLQPAVPPPQR